MNAVKIFGYSKPIIKESFNPDRTQLTIFLDGMVTSNTDENKLNEIKEQTLSQDEEKTINFIKMNHEISRQELEKCLDCGKTKCNIILKSLMEKGRIKKIDSGKNSKYAIKQ